MLGYYPAELAGRASLPGEGKLAKGLHTVEEGFIWKPCLR